MLLQVCCWKNKQLNAFENPIFDDHEEDVIRVEMERFLVAGKLEDVLKLKHRVLYKIGTFDDESGIFTGDLQMLVDADDIIGVREVKVDEKI